ncbi:ABC transporter ATP-binding protein [Stenotrophomonas sp. ASS1]|uniref:AAA family ATPase n=1 Tax=Stenotrophomonas sp. ASS1 TaxID=2282124 RepID=UPI001050F39A|nr:AAA family ATPase [Stenotrophomonas sp. ASS1]QBL42599.1 ABC transporter ATP-binding protein [Stenotrophomonas sp. ASS1]
MTFHFDVPTQGDPIVISIEPGTSATFVGANGSGKTRLALLIEQGAGEGVHRISAHRALSLDPTVPKISESLALKGLRFGFAGEDVGIHYREAHRWAHGKAAVSLLNDFDFLVQALFAEQSRTSLRTHQNARAGVDQPAEPTKFETLKAIWERLIPHRELVITGDNIEVRAPGMEALYSASAMSDGERSVFYLAGQMLMAAPNSLLLIDEPELHVHRSIINRLGDELENFRRDCALVYITHDLEFAASRVGQKYAIQSYNPDGPQWALEPVPEETGFTEELTTLLLGSRRPILFVEGDLSSLDRAVYRSAYAQWTVIPRGSCSDVIHSVISMRGNASLTRIHCAGIVDADDYDASDIEYFNQHNIFVLPVSEVENLFLLPEVAGAIALTEHVPDQQLNAHIAGLNERLLDFANQDDRISPVVIRHTLRRIDRALKKIDLGRTQTIEDIQAAYAAQTDGFDISAIAAERRHAIETAIQHREVPALLAVFDNKGMFAEAARYLKRTPKDAFEAWIARALLNDNEPRLVAALRRVLPQIEVPG